MPIRSFAILLLLAVRLAGGEADPRLGWWKCADGPILVESNRIVLCDHSAYFCFYPVLEVRPDAIIVSAGTGPSLPSRRTFRLVGKELQLGFEGFQGDGSETVKKCTRISKPPAAQVPPSFTIPAPQALTDERRKPIVADLARLAQRGQEILKGRPPAASRTQSDAEYQKAAKARGDFLAKYDPFLVETHGWLRRTVGQTGWIDSARFGAEAAAQAWHLLELVQTDAKELDTREAEANALAAAVTESLRGTMAVAGCDGPAFARLDDAAHLAVGLRQHFGTAVWDDQRWPKARVAWLEDRQQVDAFRVQAALPPLADAMRTWSQEHGKRQIELLDALPLP